MTVLRLVGKNVRGYIVRFVLTILAVALGVAFVAGTSVLSNSLNATFDELLGNAGASIDVYVRGEAGTKRADGTIIRAGLPLDTAQKIEGVEGVAHAWADLAGPTTLLSRDNTVVGSAGAGLGVAARAEDRALTLTDGQLPRNGDEIALETETAKRANYSVGDSVSVVIGKDTVRAEVTGIISMGNLGGSSVVFFDPRNAEKHFAPDGTVTGFVVSAGEGVDSTALAQRVRDAGLDKTEVITGAVKIAEEAETVRESLGFVEKFLLVFAAVSLIVGGFLIVNTFNMVLVGRTKELAVLRSLGAGRGQIIGMVLIEAVVIGALGSGLGMLGGLAFAAVLASLLENTGLAIDGVTLGMGTVWLSLAVGLTVTTVAALVPAVRASGVPPLAAMRAPVDAAASSLQYRTALGVAIMFLGACVIPLVMLSESTPKFVLLGSAAVCIMFGFLLASAGLVRPLMGVITWPLSLFGVVATIARGNTLRNPRRTAVTSGALTIGLTLVCAVSVLSASATASMQAVLNAGVKSDLVMSGGPTGMESSVPEEVRKVDGVKSVASFDAVPVTLAGTDLAGFGANPKDVLDNVSVTMANGSMESLDEGQVVIAESLAKTNVWSTGTKVPVKIGTKDKMEYTIGGVYADNPALAGAVVIPSMVATDAVPEAQRRSSLALISVKEGADLGDVKSAIAEAVSTRGTFSVLTKDEYTDSRAKSIQTTLKLIVGLLALSITIASLGIANTLVMSVFERTREIGLLRAVGMDRRELWAMVTVESVLTAVFGAILGAALGLGLGALVQQSLGSYGLDTLAIPWGTLVGLGFGAVAIGIVAALLPALRAGRINVLDAIAE